MIKDIKTKGFYVGLIFAINLASCTDLVTDEKDSIVRATSTGSNFTAGDPAQLLASAYTDLGAYNNQGNMWAMSEHPTAELIPPTRGTDWGDNGVWRAYDTHAWDATHPQLLDTWNILNQRSYKTNEILASSPTPAQAAEAKFLRAFYMFQVLDYYGQVPIREVTQPINELPRVLTRSEAFDFVVKDLEEAIPQLTNLTPSPMNGRASKAAAYFLLAKMYLNKAVYKSQKPEGPYNFEAADMEKVISYVDLIEKEGYSLDQKYFNSWSKEEGTEVIWASTEGIPQNLWNCTLHYNMNPAGWNGFATLASFYDKFEDGDIRKGIAPKKDGTVYSGVGYGFLIGQQYTDKGEPIIDARSQKSLVFTRDVPLEGAATEKGIRVIKYHPGYVNKFVFFRFGQAFAMKAEALFRSGKSAEALVEVNKMRAVRGATQLATLTSNEMFDEQAREMYWEGVARTNEIRFEKFTTGEGVVVQDGYRVLYPIPSAALVSNPNISQNSGY